MNDNRFAHDSFFVDQLIRLGANLYRISTVASDGQSAGEPLAFARPKKLAVTEDIRFFAENQTEALFRIKARRFSGSRYDIMSPDDERIGVLENVSRILRPRSTWLIRDAAEQEIATAQEDEAPVGPIVRRLTVASPLFQFTISMETRPVGKLVRHPVGRRARYILKLDGDPHRRLDRRLAVAFAVEFDAIEGR